MDESYLTGEPFEITKTSGSTVISGAINGESALTIRTTKIAADSCYAKIMEVMRESESKRPTLRRLGDKLGAFYTPAALAVALLAWIFSGESVRFLSVLVIATPCPLLIAIPIAIIGSISCAPVARLSSRVPSCWSRSPSAAQPYSIRRAPSPMASLRSRSSCRHPLSPPRKCLPSWQAWSVTRSILWRAPSSKRQPLPNSLSPGNRCR